MEMHFHGFREMHFRKDSRIRNGLVTDSRGFADKFSRIRDAFADSENVSACICAQFTLQFTYSLQCVIVCGNV